jgi:hypothetical protein
MHRTSIIAGALALAVVPAGVAVGQGAQSRYTATLNGQSEVPRTDSPATGSAQFTVAPNQRSMRYTLRASNLTGPPMAAHIHLGRPGQAGGILITLSKNQFTLPRSGRVRARDFTPSGNVRTFAQAVRAMRAGRTYVNIHTGQFPAGEIRGQVRTR